MKTISLAHIALVAMFMSNCSSPPDPNAILSRLIEAQMAGRQFEKQPSGKDTLIYSGTEDMWLTGTSQVVNNHLVITIRTDAIENESSYSLAVYAPDGKPLFADEQVPGKLDTIIDLNGDLRPELIVDEYKGNSAGFNSIQVLYARLSDAGSYTRSGTVSERYNGGSAFSILRAEHAYQTENNVTTIVVYSQKSEQADNGIDPKITNRMYLVRWQPPDLVVHEEDGDQDVPPAEANLEEASREWDSLKNEERKARLLTIAYDYSGEMASSVERFYFDGSLSGLTFLDYELTGEGGDFWWNHLEYRNGAAYRGTFAETGIYDSENGVFFYSKDGQKYWFIIGSVMNSENRRQDALIADPPTRVPDPDDDAFSAESAISDRVTFIRNHASEFAPGKSYTLTASDGGVYSVDSLLWVKEFGNK